MAVLVVDIILRGSVGGTALDAFVVLGGIGLTILLIRPTKRENELRVLEVSSSSSCNSSSAFSPNKSRLFTSISDAWALVSSCSFKSMSSHKASSSSVSVSLLFAARVKLEFGRKDESLETAPGEGGFLNLVFFCGVLNLLNGLGFRERGGPSDESEDELELDPPQK